MRRAVGDAAGLTVKGQLRRAAENLGYEADAWRVREAWYSRAGSWSAAALDDLRQRYAAWRGQEARNAAEQSPGGIADTAERTTLATRLDAIRAGLGILTRQVDELAAEVAAAAGERR